MDILEIQTAVQAEVAPIQKGIGELKNTVTSVQIKADENTAQLQEELKQSKADIKVLKDNADKNQEWIDKQVAQNQRSPLFSEPVDLDEVIRKALEDNIDKITKIVKREPGREKQFSIDLNLKDFTQKAVGDVSISNYTGGTRGLTALRPGLITQPPRKVHVRDLIPVGPAGPGTEYVFMKENGAGEGAIASVAEGGTKPQIDIDLVEASVKFETIAGWLRVTRKAMNNIQGFVSYLQARLPEKLLRVEDALLLNGDGVTPNIKGIQVAGNFTAASGAATIDIEQLVEAISQLEELDREANGIVVRPSDYYSMLLLKDTQNAYTQPGIVTISPEGTLRILGIPVVRTTAQTVDKFLVGDFRLGAQLLIQEGIRIEFFDQDGDNVRTNKVTVRIEEVVAFPVYGSDYFIFGDFGNVA